MRSILSAILLSAFLYFLIDVVALPAGELQKREASEAVQPAKRLEPRGPGRRRKSGRPKRPEKKDKGLPKYFHEPGGSELGNHYDSRFEHGIQEYADRKMTQLHMLRAYLTFFHENRLETWLAHGTLLGWWWNGKMLPWDWDIDTQVSDSTLNFLGEHYNQTRYDYMSKDENPVKHTYLLDINPASVERERGNGLNIIDARWIDIHNGLYIDITGLSETHPQDQPGVWVCKNYHRYHTTDLYPMRETLYEGVVSKVPYAYDRILTQEYGQKALVLTEYEGHRWDPIVKDWLLKNEEELAEEKKEKEERKKAKEEEKKREEARKKEENEWEKGRAQAQIKASQDRQRAKDEAKTPEEKERRKAENEKWWDEKLAQLKEKNRLKTEAVRIEKEKSDKKAEIARLKSQQQMMKGANREGKSGQNNAG